MGTTTERREGGEGFDAEAVYSDKNDVSFPPSPSNFQERELMRWAGDQSGVEIGYLDGRECRQGAGGS